MGILSGVLSYLFGLSLNLLDAAIGGFLGALGFNLDTFETYFPAAREFHDVIIGFAVGLLFIMLIFQIFRNFGIVLDIEAEDPLKMVGKTALFFGMILYSRSIVNFILRLLTDPYAIFLGTASDPYEFELLTLITSMFTSIWANPFMSIVAMILMLVLGWQFLKLTVECVERYIVFYFALYCAPVVFATGAFKSTSQILKSWCRMLASQAILLLLNIWSIKLFMSFMPVFESNVDDIIFNFLMGFAFLKFAQKADTLLRILGLNTASTGDMVHSLGGTIAGIAMAVKSAGHMAQGVASAAGRIFGGAAANGGEGGGGSGKNGGGDVSGMGGNVPAGPRGGPGGASISGITDSGISSAKQSYVTDVLNAAQAQMGGAEDPAAEGIGLRAENTGDGGRAPAVGPAGEKNIAMESGKPLKSGKRPEKIDGETLEGLSNLAHGLPHDRYDPQKGTWSGGGFPAFTGEEANIIGASQLTPAEGYHQSIMKMADGTTGTVYQNDASGDAHVVQFASADNGVLEGTISQIDPHTGKMGEDFAFRAVHGSVPGAESFSSHAVPVRDATGGAYHVATGAQTGFLSTAETAATGISSNTVQAVGSAYTPGGTSKMAASSNGVAGETPGASSEAFSTHGIGVDTPGAGPMVGYAGSGIADGTVDHSTLPGGSGDGPAPVSGPTPAASNPVPVPAPAGGGPGDSIRQDSSIQGETALPNRGGAESPPVSTGMTLPAPQNQVRRFSKDNPANLEVFRRDSGRIETFDKPQPGVDATPNVTPPKPKK